jgi:DNA polymerase IV
LRSSPSFQTLSIFSKIWGVGPVGAREFYYDYGWRSLDDVVEHGWDRLTRAQQIGVKYYDEFLDSISREEAEEIAAIIGAEAEKLRPGMQYVITGGYRRGKTEVHDVDILISHPISSETTGGVVRSLVHALEKSGHISHTLHLGNELPPASTEHVTPNKYGFDSLEKALVVFLSPSSNKHRRVDIILAPPESVGTALLGWTGATTFERDLRIWCEKEKGWKFASEGIFEWGSGRRVESVDGTWTAGEEMVEAEKRVFRDMGLEWREPEERCTG